MAKNTKQVIKKLDKKLGKGKYWLMSVKESKVKDGKLGYTVHYITKIHHEEEVEMIWVKNREKSIM